MITAIYDLMKLALEIKAKTDLNVEIVLKFNSLIIEINKRKEDGVLICHLKSTEIDFQGDEWRSKAKFYMNIMSKILEANY